MIRQAHAHPVLFALGRAVVLSLGDVVSQHRVSMRRLSAGRHAPPGRVSIRQRPDNPSLCRCRNHVRSYSAKSIVNGTGDIGRRKI
jgi:hypothetical protein